jgi:uridine kinase
MIMNKNIKTIPPRNDVEIHLPDGQVLSGPRGAAVGEFLSAVEFDTLVMGAIVNSELRELTYPINIESRVEPVLMNTADGGRIYRRSLTFLLEKAFSDLYPDGILYVDHSISSGGYYCQVTGRDPLSASEIDALNAHMKKLVEEDLPFERKEVPIGEAIEYFRSKGFEDKVRLLKHRRKDYLTLYQLGDHMDYHHGYMVPSAGYLQLFDLELTDGGFTLHFPRRHKPNELLPMPDYPKLLKAFRQYGGWLAPEIEPEIEVRVVRRQHVRQAPVGSPTETRQQRHRLIQHLVECRRPESDASF